VLTPSFGPAIAEVFALGSDATMTGPAARGQMGQVWRLDTGSGTYAVKESFEPVSLEEAEADARFQDVAHAAGVPMPAVVRSRHGRVLEQVADEPVRVYQWVDVLPRTRALDPAQVGTVVAGIHRAVLPASGPLDEWFATPIGADRWAEVVHALRAEKAPYADELAALVPQTLELETLIAPAEAEQWCHLDLWSDNVLSTPGGGLVVLDWENAMPGVPAQELPLVLYEFGLGDEARMRSLLQAYADAGGPASLTSAADFSGLVSQALHIVELACRCWLAERPARDRHEAWVREYLDDPLTMSWVERALGVAQRTG